MINQQILNSNCKLVNTVWIEKGIIITILYYLIKNYDLLLNKIIIIDNVRYRILLKSLFPKFIFSEFTKNNKKNFYFNIRKIIKKQDVIIDYINNYENFINTKKIRLVPWFDMNDILISYIYDPKEKLYIDKYINFIINFNKCRRSNYNNSIYDQVMENKVFYDYLINKNININNINLQELNKLIEKFINKYTDTINNYLIPIEVIDKKKKNNRDAKIAMKVIELLDKINNIQKISQSNKNIQMEKDNEIIINNIKKELEEKSKKKNTILLKNFIEIVDKKISLINNILIEKMKNNITK